MTQVESQMTQVSQSGNTPQPTDKAKCALIIDHQPIYQKGMKHLILERQHYNTVRMATNIKQAQKEVAESPRIDVVIAALEPSSTSTKSLIEDIKSLGQGIPFLIISDGCSRQELLEAIDLGASGIIDRRSDEEEIIRILETVGSGAIHIASTALAPPPSAKRAGAQPIQGHTSHQEALTNLTRRQQEVLEELGRAQSNKTIAKNLHISENTVKIHVATILRTLGADNRTQAALIAQSRS